MPWLEILSGAAQGQVFCLDGKRFTLGRKSDLSIPDPWVARRHAAIFFNAGSFWLEDLESTNGTWLDKSRIQKVQLTDQAEFALGQTACRFHLRADNALLARVQPPSVGQTAGQDAAQKIDKLAQAAERAAHAAEDAARAARSARPSIFKRLLWRLAMLLFLIGLVAGGLAYVTLPLRTREARLLLLAEYSKLRPLGSLTIHRTSPETALVTLPDKLGSVKRLVGTTEVGLRYVVFPDAAVYEFRGLEEIWKAILVYFGEELTTGTRAAVVQFSYGDSSQSEHIWLETDAGNGEELYKAWESNFRQDDSLITPGLLLGHIPVGETRIYNVWGDSRGAFVGFKPDGWTPPQQDGE